MNFVGGTLFFVSSMRIRESQRVDEWDGWQDWRIGEIAMRYMEFNAYYVDMIKSIMKPGISTVLCTHHVPHVFLNGHDPSHYSFYTGMKDLVHELPFDPEFDHCLERRRTVFRKRGGPISCVPDHRTSRRMPPSVPTCWRWRAGTGGLSQASS